MTLIISILCTFSVLYYNFPDIRDYADRWHPGLRVPREGFPNHAPGNALLAEAVRQPTGHHPGLGPDPDASEVLRR